MDEVELGGIPHRVTRHTPESFYQLGSAYSHDRIEQSRPLFGQEQSQLSAAFLAQDNASTSSGGLPKAQYEDTLTPIDVPEGYDELEARPLVLESWVLGIILSFNLLSLTAVVALLLKAGPDSHYETTYSDIRYIVRYVPAVVGTISQLASRSVFFAFARIDPYLSMADSKHSGSKRHCTGDAAIAAPFIPPTAYPTHPFTTGRYLRFAAIISQLVTSYITAFKAGLLSSTALPSGRWIVTIHPGIALTLIGVYVVNISVMMWIFGSLWTHSTGLKWDPVTIADQVALFHGTNVFKDFEELELHPDEMAYKLLRTNEYRIGYWTKGVDETNIVYGIGRATLGTANQDEPNAALGDEHGIRRRNPLGRAPRNDEDITPTCSDKLHAAFCRCRQKYHSSRYPHWYNSVYAPWALYMWGLLVYTALCCYLFGFWKRVDNNDFSIRNHFFIHRLNGTAPPLGTDTNTTAVAGEFWIDVGSFKPDTAHDLILYVLLFRSLPVLVASLFAMNYMNLVDIGHRFSQPFANMFNQEASAEDTILLNYVWGIPGAVTIESLKRGHMKVAWFSFLNLFNAFFPLLVSGLFTIINTGPRIVFHVDDVSFYLCFAFIVVYAFSLPFAWPSWKRGLPRKCYSLGDVLSLCYASSFVQNTALNVNARNITQRHLESRLFLQEEKFSIGMYTGSDGKSHFGFDNTYRKDQQGNNTLHVRHVSRRLWRDKEGVGSEEDAELAQLGPRHD